MVQLNPVCPLGKQCRSRSVSDLVLHCLYLPALSASVAQLDARQTGDQEVAGSTPAEVGNILSWRLIMKYILWSFSPFRFQEGQLSVSGERMCTILVNCLED